VTAPLLALALPLLDAGIAVLRRLLVGQRVFQADLDHIHHRLVRQGLPPSRVVVLLYAVAAFFGAASLLTVSSGSQVIGLVVIAMSVATWLGLAQFRAPAAVVIPGEAPSPFAGADSLEALWTGLVSRASEAGFVRVELYPSEESEPLLEAAARRAGLPAAFPEWRCGTPPPGPIVSWRVPLVSDGHFTGTLILARGVVEDGQVGELASAIERDVARRLRTLLREAAQPTPETAPRALDQLAAR